MRDRQTDRQTVTKLYRQTDSTSQSYTPNIHKATKPAFNAGPSNGLSLAGRRWPAFVVFGSSLPSPTKTALDFFMSESKLSGSASAKRERKRERAIN